MDVDEIFRSHADELFRYLARQCGDPHLARDAVQETFVRLHENPPRRAPGIRRWLFRTGLNVIRDERRTTSNRRRILEANPGRVPRPEASPTPADRVELEDDLSRLREALGELRAKERTALLMRESGFKHREIAEELDTTTGTVGTLIARALEKLEAAMDRLAGPR